MGRRRIDPSDPVWPVATELLVATFRVWGGTIKDLSEALAQAGVIYRKGALGYLLSGKTKSAPESVLNALAEAMGSPHSFVFTHGTNVEEISPEVRAAMLAVEVERLRRLVRHAYIEGKAKGVLGEADWDTSDALKVLNKRKPAAGDANCVTSPKAENGAPE